MREPGKLQVGDGLDAICLQQVEELLDRPRGMADRPDRRGARLR
jgi:hypothetical protein